MVVYDVDNDTFIYPDSLNPNPVFDQLLADHPELDTEYRPSAQELADELASRVAQRTAMEGWDTSTGVYRNLAQQIEDRVAMERFLSAPPTPEVIDPTEVIDAVDFEHPTEMMPAVVVTE